MVDGTGSEPVRRDLFVHGGKIVDGIPQPARTIDATGLIVSPGFIDIHTHFDPQLCWDGLATPALEHGVTTVVTGNCSLSLAPVRPDGTAKIMSLFKIIQDMAESTFVAAVPWCWETFPEYLDFIRGNLGVNVGALVGHSMIRTYVMGAASQQRTATAKEIDAMCAIVEDAMAAGALGVSSSQLDLDENRRPVPSRFADRDEKIALARAMAASGRGVWQTVPFLGDPRRLLDDIRELGDISLAADVMCSLVPIFAIPGPALDAQLRALTEQRQRGARVFGQTMPRRFDLNIRLSETSMLLRDYPTWRAVMDLPLDERRRALEEPANRARLIQEMAPGGHGIFDFEDLRVGEVVSAENARFSGRAVADIARAQGKDIGDVVLDLSLRDDLETEFKIASSANADEETVAALIDNPVCHFGASDAGAHSTQLCGAGDTTCMLSRLVRETGHMSLARGIHRMTGELARDWGIRGRGVLAPGQAADIAIFDPDRVALADEEFVADQPGGARRYLHRAEGFRYVLVNGEVMLSDAGYADARPGEVT